MDILNYVDTAQGKPFLVTVPIERRQGRWDRSRPAAMRFEAELARIDSSILPREIPTKFESIVYWFSKDNK